MGTALLKDQMDFTSFRGAAIEIRESILWPPKCATRLSRSIQRSESKTQFVLQFSVRIQMRSDEFRTAMSDCRRCDAFFVVVALKRQQDTATQTIFDSARSSVSWNIPLNHSFSRNRTISVFRPTFDFSSTCFSLHIRSHRARSSRWPKFIPKLCK